MGASVSQTGLGAPEGAEPYGLGATPAIPRADEPAPMSKRMARFLANPPKRLQPEMIAARRSKCIRRSKPKGLLEELCEVQRWACHYCKRSMSRKPRKNPDLVATIDHMLPVSRGGRNQRENLVAACLGCNRAKGSMTAEEFASVDRNPKGEKPQALSAKHESAVTAKQADAQ